MKKAKEKLSKNIEHDRDLREQCRHSKLYQTGWCVDCDQKVAKVGMFKKFTKN